MSTSEAASDPSAGQAAQADGEDAAQNGVALARVRTLAERAVLVPVGAALLAGEELIGVLVTLASSDKADAQLHEFEQRGLLARDRIEQELRRRRTQLRSECGPSVQRIGEQVRNRMREMSSQGNKIASKIQAQMPTRT
jgi:hypothetical protein